jgi:excisionase family DNA binding protein
MPDPQNGLLISHEELFERYLDLRGKARAAEFVSVTDAAEIAGCSRNTVLKWINEGKVQAVKVGRRFKVWQPNLKCRLREET